MLHDAPSGFLGTAPAPVGFAEDASVFVTGAIRRLTLLVDLTSLALRWEVTPGLDPAAQSVLDKGCFFVVAAADLGLAAAAVPLTVAVVFESPEVAGGTGGREACAEELSGGFKGSATAAASVGSVVSMVTPSGFIPCRECQCCVLFR